MEEEVQMALVWEMFVDTYKAMEEINQNWLVSDHITLVAEMHLDRQSLELHLHEYTLDIEKNKMKRSEDIKVQLLRLKLESVRSGRGRGSTASNRR